MSENNCDISEETKQYLDNLLRASTAALKSEIDDLKLLVNQKNEQITELSNKVIEVVQRNVELTNQLATVTEVLDTKIDDLEQYNRKNNISD